ncbi:MAG: NAD(+)/NADH kinase [Anaerolineales bacterium]|nr:NAD(+)/NADH kinase [Anaerolineales bacterium]
MMAGTHIGILHHPKIPASKPLAREIEAWLTARDIPAWSLSTWDAGQVLAAVPAGRLLIVIGGDGSFLRAARLAAPYGVPLFCINMGRLGFLSEVQPEDWQSRLTAFLEGKHWLEQRLMLQAFLRRGEEVQGPLVALNDVVVSRGSQARVLRLQLFSDGDFVTRYVADGVIAATPTGSTAYALAAGGPILPPRLLNYLIVPVAAHLSFDRALVFNEDTVASIRVFTDHEATLTADGQDSVALKNGDEVVIKQYEHMSSFVRLGNPGYFYRRLMERLRFGLDAGPDGEG